MVLNVLPGLHSLLESLMIRFEYCSVCVRVLLVSGWFVTK